MIFACKFIKMTAIDDLSTLYRLTGHQQEPEFILTKIDDDSGQHYWKAEIKDLSSEDGSSSDDQREVIVDDQISFMGAEGIGETKEEAREDAARRTIDFVWGHRMDQIPVKYLLRMARQIKELEGKWDDVFE